MKYHNTLSELDIKFFQRDPSFNNFDNLDETRIEEIKQEALTFKNELYQEDKRNSFLSSSTKYYNRLLQALTTPNIGLKYKTFDERVIFLLFALDPEFKIYQYHIERNYVKKPYFNPYDKDLLKEEKEYLTQKYNSQALIERNEFKNRISTEFGSSNDYLIKYESAYFEKFLRDKKLVSKSNVQLGESLPKYLDLRPKFTNVTPERFRELQESANNYLNNIYVDYNTALFHIFKQYKLLDIRTLNEQIIFFILVLDPQLDILKQYCNICNFKEYYDYMYENFGFVTRSAYIVEENLRRKFMPEIKLPFDEEITLK